MRVLTSKTLWAVGAVLGMIAAAAAGTVSSDTEAEEIVTACGEEHGVPNAIADCLLRKDKEYGARLQRQYDDLKAMIDAPARSLLVESQRAWLSYQDASCRLAKKLSESEGSNIDRMVGATCTLRATLRRLDEILRYSP